MSETDRLTPPPEPSLPDPSRRIIAHGVATAEMLARGESVLGRLDAVAAGEHAKRDAAKPG